MHLHFCSLYLSVFHLEVFSLEINVLLVYNFSGMSELVTDLSKWENRSLNSSEMSGLLTNQPWGGFFCPRGVRSGSKG